ncbi:hypothetical protein PG988_006049 [Apiospora saccharicola]
MDPINSSLHGSDELYPEDLTHPTFFEDAWCDHSPAPSHVPSPTVGNPVLAHGEVWAPVVTDERYPMRQEESSSSAPQASPPPLGSPHLSEYLDFTDACDPSTLAPIPEPIGSEPLGPSISNEHVPRPPAQTLARKAALNDNLAVPTSGPLRSGGAQNPTQSPLSSEVVPRGKVGIPSLAQSRKSKRADDGKVPEKKKKTASSCLWCRFKHKECSDGKPCHLCLKKAVEARATRTEQYILAANRCKSGFEEDDFDWIYYLFCGFTTIRGFKELDRGNDAYVKNPDGKPVEEDVLANLQKKAYIATSSVASLGNHDGLPRFLALQVSGLFHHASDKKPERKMDILKMIQAIEEHFPRNSICYQPSSSSETELSGTDVLDLGYFPFLLSQFVFLLLEAPCYRHADIILRRLYKYLRYCWNILKSVTSGQGSSRDVLMIIATLYLICRRMKDTWTDFLKILTNGLTTTFWPSWSAVPPDGVMFTTGFAFYHCEKVLRFCVIGISANLTRSYCFRRRRFALKREFSALNKREGKQAIRKTSEMQGILLDRFEDVLDQHRKISGGLDFTFSCIHTVEFMRNVYMEKGI